MSKTEECWVIKDNRKNEFLSYNRHTRTKILDVSKNLCNAIMFKKYETAKDTIEIYNLQNCRPVKVEIRVVGE